MTWNYIFGISSANFCPLENIQSLIITKQCSLLGQLDSIISSKQQCLCSGRWTEWWKQQQALSYSNATLKWDSLIVDKGTVRPHFPGPYPLSHPIHFSHPSSISLTQSSIPPPHSSPTPHLYNIPYPIYIAHLL